MSTDSEDDDPIPRAQVEREPRFNVMLGAVVERFGGGAPTTHRVRDLSAGGVRIDRADDLRVGATVLVTVGSLQSVGATVVWVRDGAAGLKFAQRIDPDQAKAKAMVAPRSVDPAARGGQAAGWIDQLTSPYRRR